PCTALFRSRRDKGFCSHFKLLFPCSVIRIYRRARGVQAVFAVGISGVAFGDPPPICERADAGASALSSRSVCDHSALSAAFFAGAFLAAGFLAAGLSASSFFAAGFLAGAFFAAGFSSAASSAFLAAAFFAGAFLAGFASA